MKPIEKNKNAENETVGRGQGGSHVSRSEFFDIIIGAL